MNTPLLAALAALLMLHILACGVDNSAPDPTPQPRPDASADTGADTPPDAPADAPVGAWTWRDVPGMVCGDGEPTGVGVNPSDRSDDVVIFLQGGGACWDVNSCFILRSSINIESGYTAAMFANEATRSAPPFDRADPANPFKDATFIFVPYCTGDLHSGDNVKEYAAFNQTRAVHHKGAANIDALLRELGPTLADKKRVWLTGVSAGGYGAQLNYHRFAAALPGAEVHALADCSPMVTPWAGRLGEMSGAWRLQTPPGCEACATSFPAVIDHLATTYPQRRFALLTYDADNVISLYFNYPLDGTFGRALNSLLRDQYDPHPNARYFARPGTEHVMLGGFKTLRAADGTPLRDWIAAWATGAPSWSDVGR